MRQSLSKRVSSHVAISGAVPPASAADERAAAVQLAAYRLAWARLRDVPVDDSVLRPAAVRYQLPIRQWIFAAPDPWARFAPGRPGRGARPLGLTRRAPARPSASRS